MTRCDVGNHLGDEERVVFRTLLGMHRIISGFLLKSVKTADTGRHNHSHTVTVEIVGFFNTRILNCLTGCHHGILSIQVKLTELFAVKVIFTFKVFNLAGKLCLEQRRIEMRDRSGSADPFQCVFPRCFNVVAYWGHGSKTGYNYSFKFHFSIA